MKFETGDKVTWIIGQKKDIQVVGLFLEEKENGMSEVRTLHRNGLQLISTILVESDKLQPYEGEIVYSNTVNKKFELEYKRYQKENNF